MLPTVDSGAELDQPLDGRQVPALGSQVKRPDSLHRGGFQFSAGCHQRVDGVAVTLSRCEMQSSVTVTIAGVNFGAAPQQELDQPHVVGVSDHVQSSGAMRLVACVDWHTAVKEKLDNLKLIVFRRLHNRRIRARLQVQVGAWKNERKKQ